jgi:hypothetical protein
VANANLNQAFPYEFAHPFIIWNCLPRTRHPLDLVEVPFVAKPSGGSPSDFASKVPPEFFHPSPTVWCET